MSDTAAARQLADRVYEWTHLRLLNEDKHYAHEGDVRNAARVLRDQADEIDLLRATIHKDWATIAALLAVPDETRHALIGREALDPFEEGIEFGTDQTYRRMAAVLTEQEDQ